MPLPRGRVVPLLRQRSMVLDVLYWARDVHLIMVERTVSIPDVVAAREAASPKPGWYPVLIKSYALACMNQPELRRSLLTFPYWRIHEHACSVASITCERNVDGQPAVLLFQVREPERTPLIEIHDRFQRVKREPVEAIADFRRLLRMSRMPWPMRRLIGNAGLFWSGRWREKYAGTFTASSTLAGGAALTLPCTALSAAFTFDTVQPDGSLTLRLACDHRVMDGMTAARGLAETERMLHGPILDELRSLACGGESPRIIAA
jgi:hypothetical protein